MQLDIYLHIYIQKTIVIDCKFIDCSTICHLVKHSNGIKLLCAIQLHFIDIYILGLC